MVVCITSRLGLQRQVSRLQLAELLVEAISEQPERDDHAAAVAFIGLAPGGQAGAIILSSLKHATRLAGTGYVPCPHCGRFVSSEGQGVEWHMKQVHGTTEHAEAFAIAASARHALVPYEQKQHRDNLVFSGVGGSSAGGAANGSSTASSLVVHGSGAAAATPGSSGATNKLQRYSDMAMAQADPAVARRLVEQGRVRALGDGLDACRSGDLEQLKALHAAGDWNAPTAKDKHGSGPMLWAAGGGHLDCCKFLAEKCGVSPVEEVQQAKRGYDGRSALHWAARNGHLAVVKWLVEEQHCDPNVLAADKTAPAALAIWQGQLEVFRYLVARGADPHATNAYGCNAAMWAAQGPGTTVHVFNELRALHLNMDAINNNGQGCLHKAAQRGNKAICVWLLEVAKIRHKGHFKPNLSEKSVPSALARYSEQHELAAWLEAKELEFG